jgi:UDP-hydrolysing UDP-N-acetyl-D-glucosamine 2-epimerase
LQYGEGEKQIRQLLEALHICELPVVFTMPNADTGNQQIRTRIQQFVAANTWVCQVENLGVEAYASVMALAAAMVGNSSSGILEAASFKLPVVNIGIRQAGRLHGKNVMDVGNATDEIVAGIKRAVEPTFRASLNDLVNPYATGYAVARILQVLKEAKIDASLLQKRFYDLPTIQQTMQSELSGQSHKI